MNPYDLGGHLPPGATVARNDSGWPELIFTPAQLARLRDQVRAELAATRRRRELPARMRRAHTEYHRRRRGRW